MENLKNAVIHTAGAFILLDGLYPFALGEKLHHGNIPVIRLGGHVESGETGWQCAVRELWEEARMTIRPLPTDRTFHVLRADPVITLHEIEWDEAALGSPRPCLVVEYPSAERSELSLMYRAATEDVPCPSMEVKGILLLDPLNIQRICRATVTLSEYLSLGGKAIFTQPFDPNLTLEPFFQLRVLAKILEIK